MLHGDPSPPKKPTYPPFPHFRDLGTLRKCPQTTGDSIGDSLSIPKMFWEDFRDVLGRFWGCSSFDNGHWWMDNMIIFPIHFFRIILNLNLTMYKLQLKSMGFDLGFRWFNYYLFSKIITTSKASKSTNREMQHLRGLLLVVIALVLLIFGVILAFTYCTWVSKSYSSSVLPPYQPEALWKQ